ncbi:SET domain [Trypanosoma melophagium]|uniref:SET domain n=1 Tax=Trypanosoma melophagium TaxID=715481 RepID=UPI003519FABD|nr:SET domain [Trypanosoma melophagium]
MSEDVLRMWEKQLAEDHSSAHNAVDTKAQQPINIAKLASDGLLFLTQLEKKQGEQDETGSTSYHRRLQEFLVLVVLRLLQSCVRRTDVNRIVSTTCRDVISPPLGNNGKNDRRKHREALREWWDRVAIAEECWRWCEAHLTIIPSEELMWFRRSSHDVTTVTEWWWRPDVVSDINAPAATVATTGMAWKLFSDILLIGVNDVSNANSSLLLSMIHCPELKVAAKFLEALRTASSDLFIHRVPVGIGILQQLYIAKATTLLHQAHLLACLSILKSTFFSIPVDGEKGSNVSSNKNYASHEMLWVSREGLTLAWQCLIAAITAVQIASTQFDTLCEDLRRRIRWALFGDSGDLVAPAATTATSTTSTSTTPVNSNSNNSSSSNDRNFFLYPLVEPSQNIWRVVHGVGLIATGDIPEGTVILQERPLLSFHPSQTSSSGSKGGNTELSTITGAALELLQLGGLSHRCDSAATHVVAAIQSGALFGHPTRTSNVWAALHLLALTPSVQSTNSNSDSNSSSNSKNNNNDTCNNYDFEGDVVSLVRCWEEYAIALRPMEDFRIQRGEEGKQRQGMKALCAVTSLINHSCSPNAMILFKEEEDEETESSSKDINTICVVTLRDIKAGEEITITYLPSLLVPRSVKKLYSRFQCRCDFCKTRNMFLEAIVCPSCRRVIYDDNDNDNTDDDIHNGREKNSTSSYGFKKEDISRRSNLEFNTEAIDTSKRRMALYTHATDCLHSDNITGNKELATQITQGFKKALEGIHLELLGRKSHAICDTVEEKEEKSDVNVQNNENKTEKEKQKMKSEEIEDDDDDYARRAQKVMRQLMDLDAFAHGLPSTHHYRLRARMECLAISLNANITPRDTARLVQLSEELLEDLEVLLLPRNHPLLTGMRLHYCLARSRHLIATTEVDEINAGGHVDECCGAVREEAETVRLPFVQDPVIRACIARSFQEHYVRSAWRFVQIDEKNSKGDDSGFVQSFLARYSTELKVCGISGVRQLGMLSLMCDTVQEEEENEYVV